MTCFAFVIFDVFISQCNVAFLVGYLIPRNVNKQIRGARETDHEGGEDILE